MIRPEWRYFEGTGWYTRHFDWQPGNAGERVVLRIGAATYETRVFVNGRFLGWHRGGSTPFCVELTQALRHGANRLQIAVDNRRRSDRIPAERFDWFNYGGLYREVGLLRLPPVFIRRARAVLVPDRSLFTIRADVVLSDPLDGVATFRIPELSITIDIPLYGGVGTGVVAATPALWSPAMPKLYDVEFRFGDDVVTDRIGFREIRAAGQQLLLNGAPIQLRGICVHEDDVVLGKCSTEEQVRRLFAHAAELNCNFLRLAHYPHHERVARMADELGFLLWEEVPVYWDIDFASVDAYRDAENQLLELVHRDGNRASVIFWSLGNETPDKEERNRFMAGLSRAVRRADNTRLVTAACSVQDGRFEDRLGDVLDVVGFNEYFGWYDPDLGGLDRALHQSKPQKPVLISETGADALAGLHDARGILSSEERQAEVYRQQFKRLGGASFICGVSPWLLYDFRSERRQSSVQRGFNRKGLIAEDKTTKKLAFSVLAEIYRQLAAKLEERRR
jgi:beta-glucuronidase